MATERTIMLPDGTVVTFSVADQTVMTPLGGVVNAKIVAAGGVVHRTAGQGGLAGPGGLAGRHGGLAG